MGNAICGCRPSNNETSKNDNSDLPTGIQRNIEAKKQRRRLSVAPQQVGDIQSNKESLQRMSSKVNIVFELPKSYVAITKKGYVPYNKNKVNQDSYFCNYQINNENNTHIFGVADGHGEFGHRVSQFVAKKLPYYIQKSNYKKEPIKSLEKSVSKVASLLSKASTKINTTFSGTTLVFSLIIDNIIYTGNLGDSRGIIINIDENKKITTKALSIDHKPELENEYKRIIANGGRVAPLPGPIGEDVGPQRVWLADIDVPGLAMSRSLGDDVAHSVGVSNIPEILIHKIQKNDKFLIYGSDGIWEFLPNDTVASIIVKSYPNLKEASQKLMDAALNKWKSEEEVIDDITAVIFELKQN